MARTLVIVLVLLGVAVTASAQTVYGERFQLTTGPCTIRSGVGAPSGSLGNVCDVYYRTDSPYTIYSKTDASTWTAVTLMPSGATAGDLITAASATGTGRIAAAVTGQVLASSGTGTPPLYTASPSLTSIGGAANLTLNPTGNVVFTPGSGITQVTTSIQSPAFVSQTTGWRATNIGEGDFRYLFADELHAKSFIADLEQALAGGQIISKSVAVIATNFTCPAAGGTATLTVEDLPGAPSMQVFQASDWVVVRTFNRSGGSLTIGDCVGTVSSPSTPGGTQSWTFTRGTGGNAGAMSASTVVAKGGLALDYGVSGNGYYEVNAIDGANALNSPYAQVVTWATSPVSANRTLRARFGNLRGITSVANEYGFIAGTYAATNGQYLRASNSAFELHGIDLRMWDGATNVFRIDRGGGTAPFLSMGSPAPTTFASGTGVWMGDDGGTYKFRVGNPSGDKLEWDGTNLTVTGTVTVGQNRNLLSYTEFNRATKALPTPTWGLGSIGPDGGEGDGNGWGWTQDNTTGLTWSHNCNLPPWFPVMGGSCYATTAGTPAAGTFIRPWGPRVPVIGGARYEYSVYLGMHRVCGVGGLGCRPRIIWYDASNNYLGEEDGAGHVAFDNEGVGGNTMASWARMWAFYTAPANAAYAQLTILAYFSGAEGGGPYLFYTRPFFAEAYPLQTTPSHWSPGGITQITGDMLKTNLVISNMIHSNLATDLDTGAGFWLDARGTPTFRVGVPGGNRIRWDGTNILVKAGNLSIDGSSIRISPVDTPQGTFSLDRGYIWDVANGVLGLSASDGSTYGRFLDMRSEWNGPANRVTYLGISANSLNNGSGQRSASVSVQALANGFSILSLSAEDLRFLQVPTSGTAGALAGYMTVRIGLTQVKIPLYFP